MQASSLGPLRARRVVVSGEKTSESAGKSADAPLTVVLMHGFGAPGDDLVGLAPALAVPPGTQIVFPEAPLALADLTPLPFFGDARAWWPLDMERIQRSIVRGEQRDLTGEVPEGLASAREKAIAMLDALVAEGTRPERIVLGGFSQGGMLAADVVLRAHADRAFAGLVILSGTLVAESEWRPLMPKRKGLPVFQSHGTEDPLLPFAIAETLRDHLTAAGLSVTFHAFEGGHGIPPATMRALSGWLGKDV